MKIRQKTHAHITYPIKYHFRRSVVNNPVQLHPLVPGMCPRYRKPFLPLTYFDQELRKPGNSFLGVHIVSYHRCRANGLDQHGIRCKNPKKNTETPQVQGSKIGTRIIFHFWGQTCSTLKPGTEKVQGWR